MTERLADISAHITGVQQLGAVVNAMRGIAASRVQQVRSQLDAVDHYAAIIQASIGRLLPIVPVGDTAPAASRTTLVVFCAEQGFAGGFSEHVLDALGDAVNKSDIFLIGTRGMAAAAERGITPVWQQPMPSHSAGIPKLADIITEAICAGLAKGDVQALSAIFMHWQPGQGATLERQTLLPLDLTVFKAPKTTDVPLLYLKPQALLEEFTLDYLHAQLCRAALHAFAAENETRMQTMASAHTQIARQLEALQSARRQVRQEEITAEIIELAAGETASHR